MDSLQTNTPPEAKLHFLDYWRIIRIRKTVILSVFLLVVVTAVIVTFILPPAYSSMARIKVERDISDVRGVGEGVGMSGQYDPYFIQTEFQVIQSERILDPVVEKLQLAKKWTKKYEMPEEMKPSMAREMLKKMIDLCPERNTSLIDITVYSDSSAEARDIANAIADLYSEYRHNERERLTVSGIKAFEMEISEQTREIDEKATELEKLRKDLGVVDTDPQSTGPGSTGLGPVEVMRYQQDRIEADERYVRLEATLKKLKSLTMDDLVNALPTIEPDTLLASRLEELNAVKSKLVTLRSDLGPENPEVKRNESIEVELKSQIESRAKGILNGMETDLARQDAVVKNAGEKVEKAKENDIKIAEKNRPYYVQKAELDRLKKFRDVLMLRTFQEKVDLKLPKTTVVEIIDKAEERLVPVKPNKPLNIALGVVIGLVVGIGLAFFIEYLDTSVKTIDDVERMLQSPVLGVIPQNVGYLLEEGAESPHAEAYRVLRTNMLFSRKDESMNTIAVVSAGAGEGKSTTICNLATTFAQSGHKVLLVDSDLRRPTLHKLMGTNNNLGLTNYLLKQNTLEEVVQVTKLPSLHFLASGKLPSSSLGILSSAAMRSLIDEIKKRYDFVFFDSPPIMGVSDASVLASEVDMTMQVIQYRRYPQPMNIRAKQLIEKVGGNLIGIVLNNINMSQDESYYYYSGYYHDYYAKTDDDEATKGKSESKDGGADKTSSAIKNKY